MLTDFAHLGEWSSFLKVLAGPPLAGERLTVELTPPRMRPMRFSPTVVCAEPGKELRWLGRVTPEACSARLACYPHDGLPGVFDGEHFFQIEVDGQGSRLRQGEDFRGVLVPLILRGKLLAATRAGFEAFNAGLKQQSEAT